MEKITTFNGRQVRYIETMQVKAGVECDTYAFVGDDTQDLAIVRVTKGFKTPLQRVLQGNKTIEGFFSGRGRLVVQPDGKTVENYEFDGTTSNTEVEIKVGQLVQWAATDDTDLVFYEICDPPYQDGRFENLPE